MNEQDSHSSQTDVFREPAPSSEDRSPVSGLDIIQGLTWLARHKRPIAVVTGTATLVGLLYGWSLPNQYEAKTQIMPPKQTQSTTTFLNTQLGGGSLGEMAGGGLGLKDPNAIYVGLLKSRPIADAIIERFGLINVYHAGDMTAARARLAGSTTVVSEKSTLISISVTDKDKRLAAEIANAYTEQLQTLSKAISYTEASRRRLFFRDRLQEAKEDLVAQESAFQQLQQSKGLIDPDAQAHIIIGSVAGVRGQIAAREVELQMLRSYSTESNPDVQLAVRELSALEAEASRLEQNNSKSEFSEMGLKNVPPAGLEYLRAQRDLQFKEAYFDMLTRQYEAASLDEDKEAAVIEVVEPAIPPDRKSSPHRAILVLFFMTLGFLGSYLYLYIQELRKRNAKISQSLFEFRTALLSR